MFEIRYRILNNDSDDYYGQNGYFQIICNEYTFGYMLESDVEICSVDIENWMIGFLDVLSNIKKGRRCYLCDTESHETWFSFDIKDNYVIMSLIKAERIIGSKQIELFLPEIRPGGMEKQYIRFEDFESEILRVVNIYFQEVSRNNMNDIAETLKRTIIDKIHQIKNTV